ncbi:MlaA family lipoprotein [Sneathiella chinensis]|uniref:MlaA family lipoprotein n=1 Tax=Sneathiella chinensis TaxID=349750 RepID=UPI00146F26E9|nr:VacJ family lipoprotein [Sneathiella chinensis]
MSSNRFKTSLLTGAVALSLVGLTGTAATAQDTESSTMMYQDVYDPIEPLNRYFFDVNNALDALFLKPVAHIYRDAVPDGVKDSVSNFLTNLSQPIYFINNVAQGDLDGAGNNMGAFFTNTFLGVGGLFDVAQLETEDEDLGQTFAVWGVPEGPYLVLPVFGPNTTREAVGSVGEYFIDPANMVAEHHDIDNFRIYRTGAHAIDFRYQSLDSVDDIERNSIDFYAAIRSLYRQNRKNLLMDGNEEATPLPDISFDFEEDDAPGAARKVSNLFIDDTGTDAQASTGLN